MLGPGTRLLVVIITITNLCNITFGFFPTLQLIFGPMFSGKTSELLRRIRRYQLCNHKCLLIRYSKDVRYSDRMVVTHSGLAMNAVKTAFLEGASKFAEEAEILGIDEGQFVRKTFFR